MKGILKVYSRIILFLFPIFFLPVIYNSFILGKVSFLLLSAFLGLLIWLIDLFVSKREIIKWNKLFIWALIAVVGIVISFLRLSPGVMMRTLMSSSGLAYFLGLFLWIFIWIQLGSKEEREKQFGVLTASGIVVAILSLIAFMIPASKMPLLWPKSNPIFSISERWSITGSLISEVVMFLILGGVWLGRLLKKIKGRVEVGDYLKEAIGVIFFGLLLFLDIYKLIKSGWYFLDIRSSWVIAVEALKTAPFFGMGAGNFSQAWQLFKPASFNLGKTWSVSFGGSGMLWMTLWTELGLGALLLMIMAILSLLRRIREKGVWLILILTLLVLLLPGNFLSLFLLLWLIIFKGSSENAKMRLVVGDKGVNIMPFILAVLILVLVGYGSYWGGRILIADARWKKSLVETGNNNGVEAYNWQIKAIGMNPNMGDYRVVYSQTNMALASNFLNVDEGEEISEENREKGTVLIQQAVREAKAATALDSLSAGYWYNLAEVYRSLIGMVEGADEWSLEAYQQAIALDPVNPILKLDLGGLFYASGNYEMADRLFEEAVSNKSDYANAWYNWANSAKKLNKIQIAVTRLERSLSLVPVDSGDYEKASEELMEWKKELDELIKQNEAALEAQKAAANKEKEVEELKVAEPIPTVAEEDKIEIENNNPVESEGVDGEVDSEVVDEEPLP